MHPECYMTSATPFWGIRLLIHVNEMQNNYATSRKFAGLVPSEVFGFLNLTNSPSRTVALGSTEPLTEMSTSILPGR
jgi:hypothetical protein